MAKKASASTKKVRQQRANQWAGTARETNVDGIFGAAKEAAVSAMGEGVVVGSQEDKVFVGLPLPSLALRYLLQSTVFPLNRVLQIAGEEGSCKSALLSEVFRWFCVYGGGGVLASNENKDAPWLRAGVLQHNPLWISRITPYATSSLEEWQTLLTTQLHTFQYLMDKKGGPGRTIPVCFGIDSLTATDTNARIAETSKKGHAQRQFAEIANLTANYMRQAVVPNLRGYPFTIVGTNHMKPATDHMGRPKKNVPGGKAVPFMATFLFEMSVLGDISTADYEGIRLGIRVEKNSIGPRHKWIDVEFLWWRNYNELINDQPRQEFVWDWDTASIEMLFNFETRVANKKTLFTTLMDITGLHRQAKQRVAWSPILGIPQSDPQPYRVVGRALEQRPDILEQLYPLLGISRYSCFQPGLDYQYMIEQAKHQGIVDAAPIYQQRDNLPVLDPNTLDPATLAGEADPVEG